MRKDRREIEGYKVYSIVTVGTETVGAFRRESKCTRTKPISEVAPSRPSTTRDPQD